jgi:Tfp pilus assembly protein PilX
MVLVKSKNNILNNKRSGMALIGIVLIMFLVFSILTVAAFNFAIQTLRIEKWHVEYVEYQEQLRQRVL